MTKLETKIKNQKLATQEEPKNGAYLAKFWDADDRILLYNNGKLAIVIDTKPCQDILNAQINPNPTNYSHLKK